MVIPNNYINIMGIKTAKQKGKALENHIMEEIIKRGLDDRCIRDGASGASNREKRDINTNMTVLGRMSGIEAKNHAVPHIKDWWEQTKKLEQLGYEPILVYKLKGEGLGDSKAVVYLSTLLDLIKNQSEQNDNVGTGIQSSDKWIIKAGIEALKKVLKVLEKFE